MTISYKKICLLGLASMVIFFGMNLHERFTFLEYIKKIFERETFSVEHQLTKAGYTLPTDVYTKNAILKDTDIFNGSPTQFWEGRPRTLKSYHDIKYSDNKTRLQRDFFKCEKTHHKCHNATWAILKELDHLRELDNRRNK